MHRIRALFRRAFTPTNGSINVTLSGNDAVCAPQKKLAFRRLVCDRLSLSSYSLLDDDFRRLSRYNCSVLTTNKFVFTGLSAFLVVPGGFALLTTPSEVSYDLTSHQFKLSSATLSWLSATALTFYLTRYHKPQICFSIGVTLVGLLGSWGSLIAELYSEFGCYCGLLTSYMLFGVAVCPYRLRPLRLTGNETLSQFILFTGLRVFNHDPGSALGPGGSRSTPLMPVCVAKPIFWTAGLNTLLLLLTAWRRYYVKEKLATSKPEDIIRRYEATHGRPD
ncbi:hypothetical protein, conserved [Babesia bigemina]|uniref:Uncharacterized protein n=1 Tax=Babesia bigemina TaxID=5866 RepID=A0A061D9R7_BABBI|nr:hypothetical protein, conserved [Babesia bigemina]CDR96717.1 hypothetical protein, conserved [Babesia bigemina]|eukprot:XP_012768903.1 hypothetical protein, conserved [Babesia bigemina]